MTDEIGIKLVGKGWYRRLKGTLNSPEFDALGKFLASERDKYNVYPSKDKVFRAFRETPFSKVKVIILGMDPYHGEDQATGLAFANPDYLIIPQPSLSRILSELDDDVNGGIDFLREQSLELTSWAKQGVLLLNTALTVREKQPGSHMSNWAFFTEAVIKALNDGHSGLIWMLWGTHAKSYSQLINKSAHHILEAGHPASGCYGTDLFKGCKHFSKANKLLEDMNGVDATINW